MLGYKGSMFVLKLNLNLKPKKKIFWKSTQKALPSKLSCLITDYIAETSITESASPNCPIPSCSWETLIVKFQKRFNIILSFRSTLFYNSINSIRTSVDTDSEFAGISLINFRKFGHNFGNRSARKSIKRSEDSYYSLESNKTLCHNIGSCGRFPGDDDVIGI